MVFRKCHRRQTQTIYTRKFLDIPYAALSNSQKLDVYLPEQGNGPFPVIVSIHGGAFMGCDKGDVQVMPMLEGVKKGFAVIIHQLPLEWRGKIPGFGS